MTLNKDTKRCALIVAGFLGFAGVAIAQEAPTPAAKVDATSLAATIAAKAVDAKPGTQAINVCAKEWKVRKTHADFDKEKHTWPAFWSACAKHLKTANNAR